MGRLYDRYAPLVRMICFDETGDIHLAWDLVQEVFVVCMQDLSALRTVERFQAWLTGIVRRKIIDAIRKNSRRSVVYENNIHPQTTTSDRTMEQELIAKLRESIAQLPESERLVIQLFHLEELPVLEIVELTGMPPSTVYVTLVRATDRLRRALRSKLGTEVGHELY
ncbi:MAG: ECF RNA polymerase sigma factor SigW [Phycisphaerae bacterium]|nr:ECF RNA polymerase sigma factor SigW [Phycisphaerae bacterium]